MKKIKKSNHALKIFNKEKKYDHLNNLYTIDLCLIYLMEDEILNVLLVCK